MAKKVERSYESKKSKNLFLLIALCFPVVPLRLLGIDFEENDNGLGAFVCSVVVVLFEAA